MLNARRLMTSQPAPGIVSKFFKIQTSKILPVSVVSVFPDDAQ